MRAPLVVCSVMATSVDALRQQRDAETDADLVELRLDALESIDLAGALAGRRRPVVVTCRPTWEGGHYTGGERERLALLREALGRGAEFVDVEWRAGAGAAELCRDFPQRVVLSLHDFTGIPHDLAVTVRAMRSLEPYLVKVAVTPPDLAALGTLAGLGAAVALPSRSVVVGMGPRGLATRVLAHRFGSAWSYAGHPRIAPGQLSVTRLLREFRFREIGPQTAVFGVVGRPIAHSLSPVMHNAGFADLGADAVYLPLEAASWGDFEAAAPVLGVRGVSVTAPFKEAAFEAAVARTDDAKRTGAVNTLRLEESGWRGTNTDVAGFLAPLSGVSLGGRRACVLGAGGAARAVVRVLLDRGALVAVHARGPAGAGRFASWFGTDVSVHVGFPRDVDWDLLVNATPVGTWPETGTMPVEEACLDEGARRRGALVYDLVYNPPETTLLAEARRRGFGTISGLAMLVAQAAAQTEYWLGRTANVEVLRDAAERRLADLESDRQLEATS
jgi:3-dehydroquinate dehydratase/shikimate dehydrogenase